MMGTPIRRCLVCRTPCPKLDLARVAVAGGAVVVDPEARRQGRGAYICARSECHEAALRRGGAALGRALRRPGVTVDEQAVREGLRRAHARTTTAVSQ
jgi:predicted RNA-binding protein YlxR (DUF448 family)